MKWKDKTLMILGAIMIFFNLFRYASPRPIPPTDSAERAGYYVGYNFFLILGSILMIIGYNSWRKAKRKKEKELIDNFLNDDPTSNDQQLNL